MHSLLFLKNIKITKGDICKNTNTIIVNNLTL